MIDRQFWIGKRVFVTGHTGFKGSWLCLLLRTLGAEVTGYALEPPTDPSLFALCRIDQTLNSVIADVRDAAALVVAMGRATPEIVFHLAAQPLVRESYRNPSETYATNVMGTVNLFESVRHCASVRVVVNVTSDKCYENREWPWGYREIESLGGRDPYSSSKACSELVTAAYRHSFLDGGAIAESRVGVASARAGNVIGGGDFAPERLVPDCVRSFLKGVPVPVRNPGAIRPWQHVLEPLSGYLVLARRLWEDPARFAGPWNFGPREEDARTVEWLVGRLCEGWGPGAGYVVDTAMHPHEARSLRLDCSKARVELGWRPRWNVTRGVDEVISWTMAYAGGRDVAAACLDQITEYLGS